MLSLFKQIALTLFLLTFIWGAGLLWFISKIPASPSEYEAKTDAIVVLTGGSMRLEHGFSLLVEQKAPLLFVSGVEAGITLPLLLHNREVSDIADKVPQERVELGHNAHSTLQNAEETKAWAGRHAIKSIRLVTGNYHMPRSVYVLHKAMPEVSIFADPVFPTEFRGNGWWLSEPGLSLVLSEYHKYIASVIAIMLGITSDE